MRKIRNIFVVALVLLTVISMGNVAGTYAKYTSTETDTDTARVAKWDVKIGDNPTFAFNLFDTIKDTKDGNAEGDVKDGGTTEHIIAPGTMGEFSIDITNNSEVNANLVASFEETNASNIPLEYRLTYTPNGGTAEVGDWKSSVADLELPTIAYLPFTGTNKGTIKIEWRWAFEGKDSANYTSTQTDTTDTGFGEAETPATVSIKATLGATQRD